MVHLMIRPVRPVRHVTDGGDGTGRRRTSTGGASTGERAGAVPTAAAGRTRPAVRGTRVAGRRAAMSSIQPTSTAATPVNTQTPTSRGTIWAAGPITFSRISRWLTSIPAGRCHS
jgi:hypothetical protein